MGDTFIHISYITSKHTTNYNVNIQNVYCALVILQFYVRVQFVERDIEEYRKEV